MSSTAPPTAGESSRRPANTSGASDDADRVKVLVCGWRKAGKTSCLKTVFQDVPIKDVNYISTTQKIEKINYDSIIPLQFWDTPSTFDIDQLDVPLSVFSYLVYVIDMQQDESYYVAIDSFIKMAMKAKMANPNMKYSIFIHKAEMLSEDYRNENYAQIQTLASEAILDFNFSEPPFDKIPLNVPVVAARYSGLESDIRFSMTSVHDVSLREAWSRVIQAVMEMLPAVEGLLLNFTAMCRIDNSFLFDLHSGVILASDNRSMNDSIQEQVTEYLSRFLQFRELYRPLKVVSNTKDQVYDDDDGARGWWDDEDPEEPWMFQATRLMPKTTIALWQFTPHLVLVILLETSTWQENRGMIEYNLTFLRKGVREILLEIEE